MRPAAFLAPQPHALPVWIASPSMKRSSSGISPPSRRTCSIRICRARETARRAIVVTDTSVVLNLCLRHREELLAALDREVLAPEEVRAEFQRLAATDPRFRG